jgi:hypothetical protein
MLKRVIFSLTLHRTKLCIPLMISGANCLGDKLYLSMICNHLPGRFTLEHCQELLACSCRYQYTHFINLALE